MRQPNLAGFLSSCSRKQFPDGGPIAVTTMRTVHDPRMDTNQSQAPSSASSIPRHQAIYEQLLEEIHTGVYKPGDRLPSEALLCERFHTSRITVAKAFERLQRDRIVRRRPGSGTYVEHSAPGSSMQFGLLIPDLGTTDIFEPICQGLMLSEAARSHSLTWGNAVTARSAGGCPAEALCKQYIAQKVAGVFFAPAEYGEGHEEGNRRIAAMLESAGIPVVLLDRCFEPYPDRSRFDLVGIDNQRAGYILTRHLFEAGAERVIFACCPGSASTVEARAAGYREAMFALRHGTSGQVVSGDFEDTAFVQAFMAEHEPDGIVCANDVTAAGLMRTLVSLGVRIPEDVRMVGLDDVSYARFLPTPLTTLRQDCLEIGVVAMSVMLDRIQRPNHPVMDVRVKTELVIRESCGWKSRHGEAHVRRGLKRHSAATMHV